MFGSFGDITFASGASPKNLKTKQEYKYKVHEPVDAPVLHEFTGKGEEVLELEIELNRAFVKDPLQIAKTLEEYAETASPQPLVIGQTYYGDFVIKRIEKSVEDALPDGTVFSLKLKLLLSRITREGEEK